MQPKAVLTFGWNTPTAPQARDLLDLLIHNNSAFGTWMEQVGANDAVLRVASLDRLFRRRPGGMATLRDFVGRFGAEFAVWKKMKGVYFECDAFAYAFLKRTHNFDVILPEAHDIQGPFRDYISELRNIVRTLENFERFGTPLPISSGISEAHYLQLRGCLIRPSARLERLVIANLLINGPSDLDELQVELGADPAMLLRILLGFSEQGCVAYHDNAFRLTSLQLPILLFCLRESMGIDYIAALD